VEIPDSPGNSSLLKEALPRNSSIINKIAGSFLLLNLWKLKSSLHYEFNNSDSLYGIKRNVS